MDFDSYVLDPAIYDEMFLLAVLPWGAVLQEHLIVDGRV